MKRLITLFAMTVVLVAQAEGQVGGTQPDSTAGAPDFAVTDSTQATPQVPYTIDAWGARRDYALALGEVLLVNGIVWAYNEFPRGAGFTQVNPRSWWSNLSGGWTYDDNHFANNQFAHPFHGSLYYNAARVNGFGYWVALPTALLGSGFWECCGETHPPAINDWIATGVGGSAIGEMLYRVSSTVLDNTATGSERIWREIGAGLLNPVRGFTRLVTGRVGKVGPNPENPLDHIPNRLTNTLRLGGRWVADSGSLDEGGNTNDSKAYTGMFEVDFQFGSPFAADRRKPFRLREQQRHGVRQHERHAVPADPLAGVAQVRHHWRAGGRRLPDDRDQLGAGVPGGGARHVAIQGVRLRYRGWRQGAAPAAAVWAPLR
jgi:hypothetical protein